MFFIELVNMKEFSQEWIERHFMRIRGSQKIPKKIYLKPNFTEVSPKDDASTSLKIVKTVAIWVKLRGSIPIICESDNTSRSFPEMVKAYQLEHLIEDKGELLDISALSSKELTQIKFASLTFHFPKFLFAPDTLLINLPRIKKDKRLIHSGARKNIYGLAADRDKEKVHALNVRSFFRNQFVKELGAMIRCQTLILGDGGKREHNMFCFLGDNLTEFDNAVSYLCFPNCEERSS